MENLALDWSAPSGWKIGDKCEVFRTNGVWQKATVIGEIPNMPKVQINGSPYWFLVILAREIRKPVDES